MIAGHSLGVNWSERQGQECIRIQGWSFAELGELSALPGAELRRRLAVVPTEVLKASPELGSIQPIAGRFEVEEDTICFVPRFPFVDGTSYSVVLGSFPGGKLAGDLEHWTIERPVQAALSTTAVEAVYPSGSELPVNQLKIYLHFSQPMSEGWAGRCVRVRRADNGKLLEGVFLGTDTELWDRERRRLTLLLDPGRIKRGLVPNAEAGYPLTQGVPVFVVVEPEFRDASDRTLRIGLRHRFEIGAPVRGKVDPAEWRCIWPPAGSKDPLVVQFNRPLDHALLEHSLWVHDGSGMPLAGRSWPGPGEWAWLFEPRVPWGERRYTLIVDPRLEDLAGNSLLRVFDRDLGKPEDSPSDGRHVGIEFICPPQKAKAGG